MCFYADKRKKGDIAMLFYILYRNYIWTFIILALIAGAAALYYFIKNPGIVSLEEMKPSRKRDLLIGLRDNAGAFAGLLEPLFVLAAGRSGRKEWVMDSWKDAVESVEGYEEFKTAFNDKFFEVYADSLVTLTKDKNATKEEKKAYKAKKKALKRVKKASKEISKSEKLKVKEDKKIAKIESQILKAKKEKKKNKLAKKIAKLEKKYVKRNKKIAKAENKLYVKYAGRLVKYLFKAGIIRDTDTFVAADEKTAETYDVIGDSSLEANFVYDVHVPFWSLIVRRRDGLEKLLAEAECEGFADSEEKDEELAPEINVTVKLEENAETQAQGNTEAVPSTRKEKKAAKKAAKKEKKKAKKAAKKDKKLNKKIAKLEKKLAKAKKEKKQQKIEKKISSCEKKLSKNKALRKAIKKLPVVATETLLSKGAIK